MTVCNPLNISRPQKCENVFRCRCLWSDGTFDAQMNSSCWRIALLPSTWTCLFEMQVDCLSRPQTANVSHSLLPTRSCFKETASFGPPIWFSSSFHMLSLLGRGLQNILSTTRTDGTTNLKIVLRETNEGESPGEWRSRISGLRQEQWKGEGVLKREGTALFVRNLIVGWGHSFCGHVRHILSSDLISWDLSIVYWFQVS